MSDPAVGGPAVSGAAETLAWSVVVPVKPLALAKSRLDRADRADLALAMAMDTVTAALAADGVAAVLVVTDDERAGGALAAAGATVVADEPDAGLNPALAHGAAQASARWPRRATASLSADLPALRPAQLDRALAAAAGHPRALVADAAGTGTVLLTARPGTRLTPAYGPGSRAAHVRTGAYDLTGELGDEVPGLRRDVDTVADLAAALRLGAGPRTTAAGS